MTGKQHRSFAYYVDQVGPSIAGYVDNELWMQLLPQLSHADPSIRYALLTISSLYERSWTEVTLDHGSGLSYQQRIALGRDDSYHQAMKWYGQSLSAALKGDTSGVDLEMQLVGCLLFICVEVQQFNEANAQQLLKVGYGLLMKYLHQRDAMDMPPSAWVSRLVFPIYVRLGALLWITADVLPTQFAIVLSRMLPPRNTAIDSLATACSRLFGLIMLTGQPSAPASPMTADGAPEVNVHSVMPPGPLMQLEQWAHELEHWRTQRAMSRLEEASYHNIMAMFWIAKICLTFQVSMLPAPPESVPPPDLLRCEQILPFFEIVLYHTEQSIMLEASSTIAGRDTSSRSIHPRGSPESKQQPLSVTAVPRVPTPDLENSLTSAPSSRTSTPTADSLATATIPTHLRQLAQTPPISTPVLASGTNTRRKPFTLDAGPQAALHFIGQNCPDPKVRRRVIELFHLGPRQESFMDASAQASKIQSWMDEGRWDGGFARLARARMEVE
jgi:hypothetical protein